MHLFSSKSDLETCADPQRTLNFTCNENYRQKDCGQLKDSQFKNFGCQFVHSETQDYFACANRIDKQNILFKEPPVPKERTWQADNYNVILNFTDEVIHCGDFDIPWTELKKMEESDESLKCRLKNGSREVSLSELWIDLKTDYSFEMSPKMTKL